VWGQSEDQILQKSCTKLSNGTEINVAANANKVNQRSFDNTEGYLRACAYDLPYVARGLRVVYIVPY
jgi:hypothetical protein